MRKDTDCVGATARWAAGLAALALALPLAMPFRADEERRWRFRFEPVFMHATGNDRHVLTTHETQGTAIQSSGTLLDTESGVAPGFDVQHLRGKWTYGLDWTTFLSSQDAAPVTAAAGGLVDEVSFELSGVTYASTGPSEVLYYDTLTDTDLETWLLDLYAMRNLRTTENSVTQIQFGLRFADFDNDFHGVVGVENVDGTFIDASSNYPRMTGPLIGLAGQFTRGKHEYRGYVSQSVVFGSADLSSARRDFSGTPTAFTVNDSSSFRVVLDESIPITELRFRWTYRITDLVSAGAGIQSAIWWDVSVPPGVEPGPGGIATLDENTIVQFGVSGAVQFDF